MVFHAHPTPCPLQVVQLRSIRLGFFVTQKVGLISGILFIIPIKAVFSEGTIQAVHYNDSIVLKIARSRRTMQY